MGAIVQLRDRLVNLMTGQGTARDSLAHARHVLRPFNAAEIEATYRSSWLMRNAIDIPPYDMTRAGRDWQAKDDQIEKLEAEERRLDLWGKLRRGLVLGRLGGGALILGVSQGQPVDALRLESIKAGDLKFAYLISRHRLTLGEPITDPESPWFGEPSYFEMRTATGSTKIHPSRVIAFKGAQVPDTGATAWQDLYWGDPLAQSIEEAVTNADVAQAGFATLISQAKLDIIKMPNLMAMAATAEYETRFLKRVELANAGKSTHNALIIDAEEDWEQRQVNWAGMPDVIRTYLAIVAGATQIPATRLLGKSPDGMNSTGEGDERNYNTMIAGRQESDLRPMLDRIDDVLIPSALGTRDPNIHFFFAPLSVMSEKEKADVFKVKMDAVNTLRTTGTIPDQALAKGVQNMLVEDGVITGLDGALAEIPPDERFGLNASNDDDANEEDPSALQAGQRVAANDALPRTLYVSRKVVNVAEIKAWAKDQGLPELQDDLHVTIAFSRTPVDWIKMGGGWMGEDGKIVISPGGPRVVEPLGDRTAVLLFASTDLSWRNMSIREAGASWDHPDYQPHISLTGEPVDVSKIEPYRGKIVLGPEIFEEIDEGRA